MVPQKDNTAKKTGASAALLSIEIIILLVVFIGALIVFLFLAENIFMDHKFEFDKDAFEFLSLHVSNTFTDIMWFFTLLGTPQFLIPANILLILYFLFIKKHTWYSIKIPVISITSLLLMQSLKLGFHRARPLEPLLRPAAGYSFPSGHAFMSMTFYGLLIHIIWENMEGGKRWVIAILLSILILLIGISRVYLRVHYASDVIAGYCMGLVWLILSMLIIRKIERYSVRKISPIVETVSK